MGSLSQQLKCYVKKSTLLSQQGNEKSYQKPNSSHGCADFLVRKKIPINQETPFSNFSGSENHLLQELGL